ncbi:replicative DNA helicase [Patescibacteria group bacterium]|nr:replicative DNA helicase [Patescibacteria group bacterium]
MAKQELQEKLPPQNIEAEQSLLGCLMLDKDAIIKVSDFTNADDFYKDTHKEIYQAMLELYRRMEPIDLLSVTSRLREKEGLEKIGGSSYLTSLINAVPTATHVLNYAKIVRAKKILRDLIGASDEIGLAAFDEAEDVDVLLDKAEKTIFGIGQKSLTQNFIAIKDILPDTFNRLDELSKHKGALRGLPTGFRDLDNKLSGLQKSDLIILAARPAMGKTSLALDIARQIATNQKVPVGIFSLEMSKDQLVDRVLSAQSGVDSWKLRSGNLSADGPDNDFTLLQEAMGHLSEAPIYIDDAGMVNILQMRAMARRLQAEKGLGLLIVDYLQLMDSTIRNFSAVQQVTEISKALKALAKELNIPVLAISQLSRAVEGRTPSIPRLSDLRESGSLEQDSDVVLFIYREDKYMENPEKRNVAKIIIAKHRNGPVGEIELYFDENRTTFRSLEKDEYATS